MNVAVKEFEVEKPVSKATLKAKEKYEGKVFSSRNFGEYVVTSYVDSKEIHIKFIDTGYETVVSSSTIKVGKIKDNLKPFVCGVGYLGYDYEKNDGLTKAYSIWASMIQRCYNEKYLLKRQTYLGCSVSKEFHNFSYFKLWCSKQIGFEESNYHLDKDLLVKGNKIYSPETCCFIPKEINSLLTTTNRSRGNTPLGVSKRQKSGNYEVTLCRDNKDSHLGTYSCPVQAFNVYKEAKEDYFRSKAEKYKGKISDEAYEALKNRKVEITD